MEGKMRGSLIILLITALFLSCKKDNNGTVLVKFKYNGQFINAADIYMKAGTLANPGLPLSQFDKVVTTNSTGNFAIFESLSPGEYFFYGQAVGDSSQTVSGEGFAIVEDKGQPNRVERTIYAN